MQSFKLNSLMCNETSKPCFLALGDGGCIREFVCSSGLYLVRAGPADLSHSTDTTVKWMSSKRPGIVPSASFNSSQILLLNVSACF